MMRSMHVLLTVVLLAGSALAQHAGHDPAPGHVPEQDCPMKEKAAPSPYVGLEQREIKALSEADRQGLIDGHGMSMALAAELNRLHGPKHVLELADELELQPEQAARAQAIFDVMAERARRLGRRVIELEAELDARFAAGEIDEESLHEVVAEIGRVRGELRFAHLAAHLEMRDALSAEQIEAYDRLRGYRR